MPFQMKIQPLDAKAAAGIDAAAKPPAGKSRLKRLFERQFPSVMRSSSSDKLAAAAGGDGYGGAGGGDIDPSSLCLDRMVLSFIEESNEKQRCGRRRCNCFNGSNCDDSSDDDAPAPPLLDAAEIIKGLVPCASVRERNLLADAARIAAEKAKACGGKAELRRAVAEGLRAAGYGVGECKSRWENGEYEYLDAVVDGERLLVDVDFRAEFEIARPTKAYRAVLQALPVVFVGAADRVERIVAVASEAARLSLKKKGLHFPPWRKPEYMLSKWLAPYNRSAAEGSISAADSSGESEMRIEEAAAISPWQPPAVRPRAAAGAKVVTGLASVLTEQP